ncbi:MAG TPA: hypothetical protein VGS10_07690 [Terracidiphilus sp.]|nr:hypothetical protein [Terracidiphilus sp.]
MGWRFILGAGICARGVRFPRGGVHGDLPGPYLVLALVLNFVVVWLILIAILKLFEKFVSRKREQA